jgi:hypothetical protein
MKKLIGLTILLATINAQAFTWVKSVPIVLEPIAAPIEASFWYLLIVVHGAIDILESAAEPLPNYKAGVYTWNAATKAHSKYDSYYLPERTTETIYSYAYNPYLNKEYWSTKVIFTLTDINSISTTNITYSVTPPTIRNFDNMDITYVLSVPNFKYDYVGIGKVLAYCYRNGAQAWGRPVRVEMTGWIYRPAWRGDYWYPIILSAYSDSHWCFVGPNGLDVWVPKRVINTNFNPDGSVVTAFYSIPQGFAP